MKKYITIFAVVLIGISSCKKKNTTPSTTNTNVSNTTWEKRSDLSFYTNVFSIGETLFSANSELGGGMKSIDGGKTWESCTKNLIAQLKSDNLVGQLDTNFNKIFTDGASIYVPISQTMGAGISNPQETTIYKSSDFGTSWNEIFKNQPIIGVDKITFVSNKIFVQSSYKISVSSDNGNTWTDPQEFIKGYSNTSEKVVFDGTNFYITCNYKLYKSIDSGKSFLPVTSDSLKNPHRIVAINSDIYCNSAIEKYSNLSSSKNIYQSLNNGNIWNNTNASFFEELPESNLMINKFTGFNLYTDNLKLYAGCRSECFVFDETKKWKSLGKYFNEESSVTYFTYSLIKMNGYLYAFTNMGVYRITE